MSFKNVLYNWFFSLLPIRVTLFIWKYKITFLVVSLISAIGIFVVRSALS